MEVNVEAAMREPYDALFGVNGGADSRNKSGTPSIITGGDLAATALHERVVATAPKELPSDVFADITKVVYGLMLTNCWARFKCSPFWGVLTKEMETRAAESNLIASQSGTKFKSHPPVTSPSTSCYYYM